MDNDVWCWYISPYKYVQEAVRNCQKYFKDNLSDEYEFIANAPNPFLFGYEPCMDVSTLLLPDEASYFRPLLVCQLMYMVITCLLYTKTPSLSPR